MKTLNPISLMTTLTLLSAQAALADTPPDSAKKLDGQQIAELYEGAYATFDNVRDKVKGDIFYSIKGKTLFGIYNTADGSRGIFRGKARVKGDQFCYKTDAKEICQNVYRDGNIYYETNADGTVTSIDTLQAFPPKTPTGLKLVPPKDVLERVKGKQVTVVVFDAKEPLVADVKWDTKNSRVVGKIIYNGKPQEKISLKYKIDGDTICFPENSCYSYYEDGKNLLELNAKGEVHAISQL